MTNEPNQGIGRELGLLEGAGLIAMAASVPELEYLFRHALIQDAAYESLLKQERRSLHIEVAEALLELYPDHREDMAPVLAHHFERAEDQPRAVEYLALAARLARSRFARQEAIGFARRAVAQLPDDDSLDVPERRVRAEMRLLQAKAGIDSVPLGDSRVLLEAVIADGDALRDPALSARAYLELCQARALSGEQYVSSPDLAHTLDRATELAEQSGSAELIATALLRTGQAKYASSEFREAIELMERALPPLIDAGQFFGASIGAWHIGIAYGHLGDYVTGVAWTDRAHELGVTSGDPNATLDADLARAVVEGLRGDTATAIEYATKAATVATRVDNKACAMVAHGVVGEQHLRDGDPAKAAIAFEASAELATYCQFMPVKIEQTGLLLQTARARSGVGSVEFERYERAIELARQFGDRLAVAQLYEQRAGDRVAAGQDEVARADLFEAARLYDELGAEAHSQRVNELQTSLPPFEGS